MQDRTRDPGRERSFPELQAVEKAARRFRRVERRARRGGVLPSLRRPLLVASAGAALLLMLLPPFRIPLDGAVSSSFFLRRSPDGGLLDIEMHRGLDIAAAEGDAVRATRSGRVVRREEHPSYGKLVVVRHLFGFESYYAHLSRFRVLPGGLVIRGTVIGEVGNTGRSTGPHLHFEVRAGDRALPPGLLLALHSLRRSLIGI